MMRQFLLGVALLLWAPLAAAQTISYSPNTLPLSGDCGTVVLSAPCINLTQTWNAGGVTFTGIKLNVTDTASSASSRLLDLQIGGTTKAYVQKDGMISGGSFALGGGVDGYWNTGGGPAVPAAGSFSFSSTSNATATSDVILRRDAANTLALRNGTNAQVFNVYNTYTDASNYERGGLDWQTSANSLTIWTTRAGTGVARNLVLQSANALFLGAGGSNQWQLNNGTGNLLAVADNTYDIGASGANRPRDTYFGRNMEVGGYGRFAAVTVGTLASCTLARDGARSFVTDATATTFASSVTGGGANHVPVYCDGSGTPTWKIGQNTLTPANDNTPAADRLRAFG